MTPNLDRRYNLFPLTLPANAKFRYRIWAVDPVPTTLKLREKIRSYLWRKTLKRPVFPHDNNGNFTFAVADGQPQESVEYIGDGEKRYLISPTDVYRTVEIPNIGDEEVDFVAAMLQQALDLHLNKNPNLSRGYTNNQYFVNSPDTPYSPNAANRRDRRRNFSQNQVDIFRGFTFRVVYFSNFGLCVAIDAITSYIGHMTLAEYTSRSEFPKQLEGEGGFTRWVNDYGRRKQSVYLLNLSEHSINETILKDQRSVFQYLIDSQPQLKGHLLPTDRAATVIYKLDDRFDEGKHYSAAATLLKPKFSNASSEVRALNDTAAFPPDERVKRIEQFRKYFFGARFGGKSLYIETAAHSERLVFEMPNLIFKDQYVLSLAKEETTEPEARSQWGDRKLHYLQEYGPLEIKEFVNPFFVYPASLEKDDLFDHFLEHTKSVCRELGWCQFEPELSPYQDQAHPRNIINKLKGIVDNQRAGFILLALPNHPDHASLVYTGVKTQVRTPSKCFSTYKLRRKARDLPTYATLNALGMLVENGSRLWGLANPLTYEVHFGFDVARTKDSSLMGASVITNATSSNIKFSYKELAKRDQRIRREGIPASIIGKYVLTCLEQFFTENGRLPRNILFQRDGRFYDEELKGIEIALQKLRQNHPDLSVPLWTAAAIQKSASMKLRMFDNTAGNVRRPFSGSYILQNDTLGHLITAGAPTLRHGTPKPIQIELLTMTGSNAGQLLDVMEDVFYLSQLNWNAPEIDINLPITLRFTDQKLERFALELESDDEDEDWELQEDDFEEE